MEMQTINLLFIHQGFFFFFFSQYFPGRKLLLTRISFVGDKDQYSYLLNTSMVHVDDLARANIFLLECPTVKGRYICSSEVITLQRMSEFLTERYPEFQIPTLE